MNNDRQKILEAFREKFVEETDSGILVNWIGKSEYDLDEWLDQQLILMEQRTLERTAEMIEQSERLILYIDEDGEADMKPDIIGAYLEISLLRKALAKLKEECTCHCHPQNQLCSSDCGNSRFYHHSSLMRKKMKRNK
jgi:hypothetical protein